MDDFVDTLITAIIEMIYEMGVKKEWLMFSNDGTAMATIKNVWNYLAIIGMCLTLIYFLIEMNQKLAIEGAQNMTMKSFMAPFLKLAIAVIILHNGANITVSLLNVNNAFVTKAATGLSEGEEEWEKDDEMYETVHDEVKDLKLIAKCFACLILLLAYIVSLVLSLVWMFKAVCYKLEVLYRVGITPVALADVYSGQHSNALKWLKGFIGLALYAMAIILLPRLAMLVGTDMLVDGLSEGGGFWGVMRALFSLLIAPFAALSVAGTIKQTCKEALG